MPRWLGRLGLKSAGHKSQHFGGLPASGGMRYRGAGAKRFSHDFGVHDGGSGAGGGQLAGIAIPAFLDFFLLALDAFFSALLACCDSFFAAFPAFFDFFFAACPAFFDFFLAACPAFCYAGLSAHAVARAC